MVLDKKQQQQVVERNRNLLYRKGRKKLVDTWVQREHLDHLDHLDHLEIGQEGAEDVAPDVSDQDNITPNTATAAPTTATAAPTTSTTATADTSVSMESMVSLTEKAWQQEFNKGIHLLRLCLFKEALKVFQEVTRHVQSQGNYGEYVMYKRTQNKNTTLSALHMFQALSYEGLSNPRKAIECCNSAIFEDPGWPIPFRKRSEYFCCFEQFCLDTEGASQEEINRNRNTANIIVNPNSSTVDGKKYFDDLQVALESAKPGSLVFLEKGFYFREEGFSIPSGCSLMGASTRGCILVSKGNPTLQISGGKQGRDSGIMISRLQFRNKLTGGRTHDEPDHKKEPEESTMKSNAAHIFIISSETVTIRDCLFVGGEEGTGGILVAEEAFYQSLLELEFQNPELLGGEASSESSCTRILINSCTFSDSWHNPVIFTNSQSTAVMSNSYIYNCCTGLRAEEGSTINLFNCDVRGASNHCILAGSMATINIRGSSIQNSGEPLPTELNTLPANSESKSACAGLLLRGNSKGNAAKSYFRNHSSAVICQHSDLVLQSNCVMDIGEDTEMDNLSDRGLELHNSAVSVLGPGNCLITKNNFHNCSLVFLTQQFSKPNITENNIETCLVGIISGSGSAPKITNNSFQCVLMSLGIFIEDSRGYVTNNTFRYVGNGLDVYRSAAPEVKDNTYTNLSLPGLSSGSLVFDIQKVGNGKVEDLENCDIITFSGATSESGGRAALASRLATLERVRECSYCRQRLACPSKCNRCQQIFYCSEECHSQDRQRHARFCSLSLRDMF